MDNGIRIVRLLLGQSLHFVSKLVKVDRTTEKAAVGKEEINKTYAKHNVRFIRDLLKQATIRSKTGSHISPEHVS